MHLLLPPSEAKRAGGRGRPLRSTAERRSATSALTPHRAIVATALHELVTGDRDRARAALLLPAGVADAALAADSRVLDTATMPALRRYTGVVYDGLDIPGMTPAEQRTAGRSAWVFSGLLGVVRGDEPVPDYRVPAKAVLPRHGVAGTFWRPRLDDVVPGLLRHGLVVDLRSGDYGAMWRPRGETATRTVTVRVLSPAPRGGHAVISYNSKFGKGVLAAALVRRVERGEPVADANDVLAAWSACGGTDGVVRTEPRDDAPGCDVDLVTG